MLALTKGRPEILNLAATMALEHFTAMMEHEFLINSRHFAKTDPEVRSMWRWHAIEEIEHKGVAFDVWIHATRAWTPAKRWKVRSMMMLVLTGRFLRSEERRVGISLVRTCRSRWSPSHSKIQHQHNHTHLIPISYYNQHYYITTTTISLSTHLYIL